MLGSQSDQGVEGAVSPVPSAYWVGGCIQGGIMENIFEPSQVKDREPRLMVSLSSWLSPPSLFLNPIGS